MPASSPSPSLRLLALVLLGLAAYNALGALNGAARWAFLQQLPLEMPAAYLLAGRAGWALAWGGLAVGVWQRRRWARWGTLGGAVAYGAHGWLNRLGWGTSDYALQTLPWSLGVALLALGLTAWLVGRSGPWA